MANNFSVNEVKNIKEVEVLEIPQIMVIDPANQDPISIDLKEVSELQIETLNVEPIMTDLGGRGLPGVGLDFVWDKTKLGVKRENAKEYTFMDLIGPNGITDYADARNKPSINGVTLSGDIELKDLGIQKEGDYMSSENELTNLEIEDLLSKVE